jgi:hypothetical protein
MHPLNPSRAAAETDRDRDRGRRRPTETGAGSGGGFAGEARDGTRRWDGQKYGGIRGRLVADPPGDLRDGGSFEAAGGGAILKAGVPSR